MTKKGVLVLLMLLTGAVMAGSMSVQVRTTKLREKPSHLGRVVVTLPYGTVVETGPMQKGWIPVTDPKGRRGWLHELALTKKPIRLKAGPAPSKTGLRVSQDEVALAGKGFNEQVEEKLKADGKLDFTWVDRMETFVVDVNEILAFREFGELGGGE